MLRSSVVKLLPHWAGGGEDVDDDVHSLVMRYLRSYRQIHWGGGGRNLLSLKRSTVIGIADVFLVKHINWTIVAHYINWIIVTIILLERTQEQTLQKSVEKKSCLELLGSRFCVEY